MEEVRERFERFRSGSGDVQRGRERNKLVYEGGNRTIRQKTRRTKKNSF